MQSTSRKHKVTFWIPPPNSEYSGAAFEEFLIMIEKDSAQYEGGIILPTIVDHEDPQKLKDLVNEIKLPVVLVDTLPDIFMEEEKVIAGKNSLDLTII